MEDLLNHVARLTTLSPGLRTELERRVEPRGVTKGELLHRAGSVCTRTYWVQRGLLRSYYLKNGREVTDFFAAEQEWLTAAYSFMTGQADQSYLQALEPGTVYGLGQADLLFLFEHLPEMERFGRITLAGQFLRQSERLAALQFSSAAERYAHFCQSHRALLPRLPLGMVAAYLGIAPETLSRLRSAP
ncbi:Crp/Fnr family transcriptional regulator [Hymenobacter coalescens]